MSPLAAFSHLVSTQLTRAARLSTSTGARPASRVVLEQFTKGAAGLWRLALSELPFAFARLLSGGVPLSLAARNRNMSFCAASTQVLLKVRTLLLLTSGRVLARLTPSLLFLRDAILMAFSGLGMDGPKFSAAHGTRQHRTSDLRLAWARGPRSTSFSRRQLGVPATALVQALPVLI